MVCCAALRVLPRDLIVGDADGVIAVPAAEANEVLRRTPAPTRRPNPTIARAAYLPYSAITFDAARKLSTAAGTPQ
jgi:regulator of RNase E activity RraA